MSAMDTALRALIWAGDDYGGRVPAGTLAGVTELARPPAVVRRTAARLAAVTAARLRLAAPPFGDHGPLVGETILVAAAVGACADPAAPQLLRAAGHPSGSYDLLARHALAAPMLASGAGDENFLSALREASPLSALLDHPGGSAESAAEAVLDDLLDHPDGRRLLTEFFGRVPESPDQSHWRGTLLQRLRSVDQPLVLDVYETATSRYATELRVWVADAGRGLTLGAGFDRARVEAVAKWWQALAFLERSQIALLRRRRGLRDYEDGVGLYRNAWRLGVVR